MDKRQPDQANPGSKPAYSPPEIVTYTHDEIVEIIGPAMACTPSDCLPDIVDEY